MLRSKTLKGTGNFSYCYFWLKEFALVVEAASLPSQAESSEVIIEPMRASALPSIHDSLSMAISEEGSYVPFKAALSLRFSAPAPKLSDLDWPPVRLESPLHR